jgi:hypothetical protein
MKNDIIDAVIKHAEGNIAVHKTNIKIYLANPAGIGEHSDIVEAVIAEAEKIAHWDDVIEVMESHFE